MVDCDSHDHVLAHVALACHLHSMAVHPSLAPMSRQALAFVQDLATRLDEFRTHSGLEVEHRQSPQDVSSPRG